MNPFNSLRDYERFVYSLQTRLLEVVRSTLVVHQRGRLCAEVSGELLFHNGCRMVEALLGSPSSTRGLSSSLAHHLHVSPIMSLPRDSVSP